MQSPRRFGRKGPTPDEVRCDSLDCRKSRSLRIGARQECSGSAGGAIGFVVRVMQSDSRFFDMRARVRSVGLEERGERKENLRDREEEQRGTPQGARKNAGLRHEGHLPREVNIVRGEGQLLRANLHYAYN